MTFRRADWKIMSIRLNTLTLFAAFDLLTIQPRIVNPWWLNVELSRTKSDCYMPKSLGYQVSQGEKVRLFNLWLMYFLPHKNDELTLRYRCEILMIQTRVTDNYLPHFPISVSKVFITKSFSFSDLPGLFQRQNLNLRRTGTKIQEKWNGKWNWSKIHKIVSLSWIHKNALTSLEKIPW